jgi:nucleoid-associated protein YgaU
MPLPVEAPPVEVVVVPEPLPEKPITIVEAPPSPAPVQPAAEPTPEIVPTLEPVPAIEALLKPVEQAPTPPEAVVEPVKVAAVVQPMPEPLPEPAATPTAPPVTEPAPSPATPIAVLPTPQPAPEIALVPKLAPIPEIAQLVEPVPPLIVAPIPAPVPEVMAEPVPVPEPIPPSEPAIAVARAEPPKIEPAIVPCEEIAPIIAPVSKAAPEGQPDLRDLTALMRASSRSDIAKAVDRLTWAKSKNAINNYPAAFYKASGELDAADFAWLRGDYISATTLALQAFDTLMRIKEFAPLPSTYIVRLIPERRDCLWRIAEYEFVYGNPLKWKILYEANKKTFKDPANPNLIFPRQILTIPSLNGEFRQGVWDPDKTYPKLVK